MMSDAEKAAWLQARAGKLTASRMKDAMDFLRNGQPSAKRITLMHELLAERLTGDSVPHVVTEPMLWGLEKEDEAVERFIALTGRDVRESHFYEHDVIENFGATPDRELDDGLLEVKCPTTPKYVAWKLAGVVPEEHKPQMCAQLACSGKAWCGFIAYDPRIKEPRHQMFLARYEPTIDEINAIEHAAKAFLDELESMWEIFHQGAA
jgi:predicted phage-related endonuclease